MDKSLFQLKLPGYSLPMINKSHNKISQIAQLDINTNDQISSQSLSDTTRKVNNQSKQNKPIEEQIYLNIQALTDFDKKIGIQQQNYSKQLSLHLQGDIMLSDENLSRQEKANKFDQIKQTIYRIMSMNEDNYESQKLQFLQKNGELERQITFQIQTIDSVDTDIIKYSQIQEERLLTYQKKQQQLKKILKKKGQIDELQRKQQQVKQKAVDIRTTRQMLQSLKDQKKSTIQSIIDKLEQLNAHRVNIIQKLQKRYWNGIESIQIQYIVGNFIKMLEELKGLRQVKQKQNYNVLLSGRRNSFSNQNNTKNSQIFSKISPFEASPSSVMKPAHQLKTSLPPGAYGQDYSVVTLDKIIDRYHELIQAFNQLQKQKDQYVETRMRDLQRKCRIQLLQKIYIRGILNVCPQQLTHQRYTQIIEDTIARCSQFMKTLQIKSKEIKVLLGKVKNISDTQQVFSDNIKKINEETKTKKIVFKQIQKILRLASEQQKSSNIKNYHKQVQKLKIRRTGYEKDLEQFAQTTNLQGYKLTKVKMIEIDEEISEMQNRFSGYPVKQYDLAEYFKSIAKVLERFEDPTLTTLLDRIWSRDPLEALAKANKRLLPL